MKTILIGLDGGDWDVINKNIENLPNINKIKKQGAYGPLQSTMPFITGPAWTSMFTGVNPGKHGIYHFLQPKSEDYSKRELINYDDIEIDTLFDILDSNGKKQIIMNIPNTYPPPLLPNAIIVSGFLTNSEDSKFVYPQRYKEILQKDFGYEISLKPEIFDNKSKCLAEIQDILKKQMDALKYLIKEHNPDFVMYNFQVVDQIQHYYWGDSLVDEVYKLVDKYIGEITLGFDNIIIVSDHGFREQKYEINVNKFLEKEGYLKYADKGFKGTVAHIGLNQNVLGKMVKKLKLEKVKDKIPNNIKRAVPKESGNIDFTKSVAVAYACGLIYVFDKSKISEIKKKLLTLKHNDKSVINKIYEKTEIYTGRYFDYAPDLVIVAEENYGENADGSEIITPVEKRIGTHRRNGIFITNLPTPKKQFNLLDITPTVLRTFGISKGRDMDGDII